MTTQSTPVRRSKRFQPLVSTPRQPFSSGDAPRWCGDPVYARKTIPEDLYENEIEALGDEEPSTKSAFYEGLSLSATSKSLRPGQRRVREYADDKKRPVVEKETFRVGDTVLVSTSSARFPSICVILSMWEIEQTENDNGDDENKTTKERVRVHWFLRPREMAGIRAKRDHFENEIYFSLASTAVIRPDGILTHCTVSSQPPSFSEEKSADAWSLSPKKPKAAGTSSRKATSQDGKDRESFYCRFAVDSYRGIFYEFQWESHQHDAMKVREKDIWITGKTWNVDVEEDTSKTPRKRRRLNNRLQEVDLKEEDGSGEGDLEYQASEAPDSDDELQEARSSLRDEQEEQESSNSDEEDDDPLPKTPSKKRTRAAASSPRKSSRQSPTKDASTTPRRTKTLAQPTPHSKAALKARRSKATSKATVAVRPPPELHRQFQLAKLPSDPWLRAMHILHVAARPDFLPCRDEEYNRVLRVVEELLEEGSGGCVYISGVPGTGKTATVHAIVRELKRMAEHGETNPFTYVEINGLKIPEAPAAYRLLWEAVSGHDVTVEGHMTISAKESLRQLTKHFSGSGGQAGPGGHACVVLMDELDQLVTAKQDVVYNFFNWPTLANSKLIVLAVANTMDLPERVMTGRVRSRLGMIRINFQPYTTPQLEKIVHARLLSAKEGLRGELPDVIAPDGVKFAAMKVSSISGDARRVLDICRRTVELVQPHARTARTEDVKEVIKVMQNSPTAAYLRECSFHERVMLAALIKCVKRGGVEEIQWGEVQHQHLIYMNVLPGEDDPTRKPTPAELALVLDSLMASRAVLMEDGTAASRKPDRERRMMLNIEQLEVERVLSESGGPRWKNVLSV